MPITAADIRRSQEKCYFIRLMFSDIRMAKTASKFLLVMNSEVRPNRWRLMDLLSKARYGQ